MKILALGCATMREGVVISAVFFLAAILMILAGNYVVPAISYMRQIVMLVGLLLLLLAPVVLVSIFLLTVLPGAKEKLGKCEH